LSNQHDVPFFIEGSLLELLSFFSQDQKVPKYVQISPERYSNLIELEEQIEILNAKIKVLNEKVSAAQSEMNNKDALVKQHAKVAEEAVSGEPNCNHSFILLF
jgi:TolA-binding protein